MLSISQSLNYKEYKCLFDIVAMDNIDSQTTDPFAKLLDYIYTDDSKKLGFRVRLNSDMYESFHTYIDCDNKSLNKTQVENPYGKLAINIHKLYDNYGSIIIPLFDILNSLLSRVDDTGNLPNGVPKIFTGTPSSVGPEFYAKNTGYNPVAIYKVLYLSFLSEDELLTDPKLNKYYHNSPFTMAFRKIVKSMYKYQKQLSIYRLSQLGARTKAITNGLITRVTNHILHNNPGVPVGSLFEGTLTNEFVKYVENESITTGNYCDVQGLLGAKIKIFTHNFIANYLTDSRYMDMHMEVKGKDGSMQSTTESILMEHKEYTGNQPIATDLQKINKINNELFSKDKYPKLTYTLYEWYAQKQLHDKMIKWKRIMSNKNDISVHKPFNPIYTIKEDPLDDSVVSVLGASDYTAKINCNIEFINHAYAEYDRAESIKDLFYFQQSICTYNDHLLSQCSHYKAPYLVPGRDYLHPDYLSLLKKSTDTNKLYMGSGNTLTREKYYFNTEYLYRNWMNPLNTEDIKWLSESTEKCYYLTESGVKRLNELTEAFDSLNNLDRYLANTPEKLTLADLPLKKLLVKNQSITELSGLLNLGMIELTSAQENYLKTRYKPVYSIFTRKTDIIAEQEQFKHPVVNYNSQIALHNRRAVRTYNAPCLNNVAGLANLSYEQVYLATLFYILKLMFPDSIDSSSMMFKFKENTAEELLFKTTNKLEFYRTVTPQKLKIIFGLFLMLCKYSSKIANVIKNNGKPRDYKSVVYQFCRFFTVNRNTPGKTEPTNKEHEFYQIFIKFYNMFNNARPSDSTRVLSDIEKYPNILNHATPEGFNKNLDLEYALQRGEAYLFESACDTVDLVSGNYSIFEHASTTNDSIEDGNVVKQDYLDTLHYKFPNEYIRFNFYTLGRLLKYNNDYYILTGDNLHKYYGSGCKIYDNYRGYTESTNDKQSFSSSTRMFLKVNANLSFTKMMNEIFHIPYAPGNKNVYDVLNILGVLEESNGKKRIRFKRASSSRLLSGQMNTSIKIAPNLKTGDNPGAKRNQKIYEEMFVMPGEPEIYYDNNATSFIEESSDSDKINVVCSDGVDLSILFDDSISTTSREMLYERCVFMSMLDPFVDNRFQYRDIGETTGMGLGRYASNVITPTFIYLVVTTLLNNLTVQYDIYDDAIDSNQTRYYLKDIMYSDTNSVLAILKALHTRFKSTQIKLFENKLNNLNYMKELSDLVTVISSSYNKLIAFCQSKYKDGYIISIPFPEVKEFCKSSWSALQKKFDMIYYERKKPYQFKLSKDNKPYIVNTNSWYRIFEYNQNIDTSSGNLHPLTHFKYNSIVNPDNRIIFSHDNKPVNIKGKLRHSGFIDSVCNSGEWLMIDTCYPYITCNSPVLNPHAMIVLASRCYAYAYKTSYLNKYTRYITDIKMAIDNTFHSTNLSNSLINPTSLYNSIFTRHNRSINNNIIFQVGNRLSKCMTNVSRMNSAQVYMTRLRKSHGRLDKENIPIFNIPDNKYSDEFITCCHAIQYAPLSEVGACYYQDFSDCVKKFTDEAKHFEKSYISFNNKIKSSILIDTPLALNNNGYLIDKELIADAIAIDLDFGEKEMQMLQYTASNATTDIVLVLEESDNTYTPEGLCMRNGVVICNSDRVNDKRIYLHSSGVLVIVNNCDLVNDKQKKYVSFKVNPHFKFNI